MAKSAKEKTVVDHRCICLVLAGCQPREIHKRLGIKPGDYYNMLKRHRKNPILWPEGDEKTPTWATLNKATLAQKVYMMNALGMTNNDVAGHLGISRQRVASQLREEWVKTNTCPLHIKTSGESLRGFSKWHVQEKERVEDFVPPADYYLEMDRADLADLDKVLNPGKRLAIVPKNLIGRFELVNAFPIDCYDEDFLCRGYQNHVDPEWWEEEGQALAAQYEESIKPKSLARKAAEEMGVF